MEKTNTVAQKKGVTSTSELLSHWQGHRGLTRQVLEAFPEKDFMKFSIGGMRTPVELSKELLSISAPGIREISTGVQEDLDHEMAAITNKKDVLEAWDRSTEEINQYFLQIPDTDFDREVVSFGKYPGTILSCILYFIDNEIHHRGQLYVYLRALGIEPPMFWDR